MRTFAGIVTALFAAVPVLADAPDPIRVVSYNIHHGEGTDGRVDLQRIAGVIEALAPDVVCLQEVDRGMPRTNKRDMPAELAELLDMQPVYGPNLIRGDAHYGNLTLTRLEVEEHENIALPKAPKDKLDAEAQAREPRGALRVRVQADKHTLDVWNTHWGLASDERAAQGQAMAAAIRARRNEPVIAVGDFNEERGAGLAMLESFLRCVDLGKRGSFPASEPLRMIDHIWHSESLTAMDAGISSHPETHVASDHLPIWAVIALPTNNAPGETDDAG
ncbi:MAG: endonuclease/exonuclease/phosphatase family protein [Candidatus Hydrogenedentota bacterium]